MKSEFSKEVWSEIQSNRQLLKGLYMLALENATSNIIKEEMQIKISYRNRDSA